MNSQIPTLSIVNIFATQDLKKSNLYCTRGITPKRVASGKVYFRYLAPVQHSSEETSQRWRVVGDAVSI